MTKAVVDKEEFEAFMDGIIQFCQDQREYNQHILDLIRISKELLTDHEQRIMFLEASTGGTRAEEVTPRGSVH